MTTLQAIEKIECPSIFHGWMFDNQQDYIEAFQHLIDNGVIWKLQGGYKSMARVLIGEGMCFMPYNPNCNDTVLEDTFSA
tara:strand:- start:422 stop:661 length:240 start_codon:yes stop_codon:yes gene_type:complete